MSKKTIICITNLIVENYRTFNNHLYFYINIEILFNINPP